MMKLKVCGRFEVPEFEGDGYTHMISIGDSDDFFDGLRHTSIAPENYLILKFTDTDDPDHDDSPTSSRIEPLYSWLSQRGPIGGLLIHCAGGISRSPAVALLSLCFLEPEADPLVHMRRVAKSSECGYIWPNRLVLAIGEHCLDRVGAITDAVDEWGKEDGVEPLQFF